MKKLMIAALAAASVGVAFAADCDDPTGNVCVYAYRIKLAGKTVKSKYLVDGAGACEDGNTNCWAKAASHRVAGYLWGITPKDDTNPDDCKCDCIDLAANQIFWDENKTKVNLTLAVSLYEVLRNSGAMNKAQIAFTFGGLNLAGFGVFNPNTARLKRAHGFYAGVLDPVPCTVCDEPVGDGPYVFTPCEDGKFKGDGKRDTAATSLGSIAYGRWNMAWKHEKVAALEKGKYAEVGADKIPSVLLPAAFNDPSSNP